MFQENLLNDGFDLIAAEIFSDDPKSSIESLKVSLNKDLHVKTFSCGIRNPGRFCLRIPES